LVQGCTHITKQAATESAMNEWVNVINTYRRQVIRTSRGLDADAASSASSPPSGQSGGHRRPSLSVLEGNKSAVGRGNFATISGASGGTKKESIARLFGPRSTSPPPTPVGETDRPLSPSRAPRFAEAAPRGDDLLNENKKLQTTVERYRIVSDSCAISSCALSTLTLSARTFLTCRSLPYIADKRRN